MPFLSPKPPQPNQVASTGTSGTSSGTDVRIRGSSEPVNITSFTSDITSDAVKSNKSTKQINLGPFTFIY